MKLELLDHQMTARKPRGIAAHTRFAYGGSGGGGDLRKQEEERQARINQGMGQINAVFDGTRGVNPVTAYQAGQRYYDQYGQLWDPQPPGGGYPTKTEQVQRPDRYGRTGPKVNGGTSTEERAMTPEEYRASQFSAGKLFTGTESVGGFDDSFYNRRQQDYLDYALPQVENQANRADKSLTFNLARRGLLDSSAGLGQRTELNRYTDQQRRNVADQAQGNANELRQEIERQRSQAFAQLQNSGDPAASADLALRTANAYRQPTSFQPIGNFFEDWTRNYAANEAARAADPSVQPLFSFGANNNRPSTSIVG